MLRRRSVLYFFICVIAALMFGMAAAVLYSVNIFSFNTQNYELLKFAVSTLFGFSIASLIYFSAYRPVVGFCGIKLVKLQRPLNLLEGEKMCIRDRCTCKQHEAEHKGCFRLHNFGYLFSDSFSQA